MKYQKQMKRNQSKAAVVDDENPSSLLVKNNRISNSDQYLWRLLYMLYVTQERVEIRSNETRDDAMQTMHVSNYVNTLICIAFKIASASEVRLKETKWRKKTTFKKNFSLIIKLVRKKVSIESIITGRKKLFEQVKNLSFHWLERVSIGSN